MKIERRTVGDVVVQEGHTRLVLDLGHVRYVDSTGLGDLVQAYTAARNRGGAVKLINVTKRLNDLFAVTKLLPVFDRFEQESEALTSFEQDARRRPGQVRRCA